jgi:hypothetical protein
MPEINFFWDPLSDNILQERDESQFPATPRARRWLLRTTIRMSPTPLLTPLSASLRSAREPPRFPFSASARTGIIRTA